MTHNQLKSNNHMAQRSLMAFVRNLILVFGLCGAMCAYAGSNIYATKITGLQPRMEGGMPNLFVTIDKASAEPGCTHAVGVMRVDPAVGVTDAGFKLFSQAIQLAFLTNKSVTLYVEGCLNNYYPKIFAVDVLQ